MAKQQWGGRWDRTGVEICTGRKFIISDLLYRRYNFGCSVKNVSNTNQSFLSQSGMYFQDGGVSPETQRLGCVLVSEKTRTRNPNVPISFICLHYHFLNLFILFLILKEESIACKSAESSI